MDLEYRCPRCGSWDRAFGIERIDRVRCRCGHERPLRRGAYDGGSLDACPWCATPDLYAQKDFPRRLGVAILLLGLLISSIFYYYLMPLWSMAVLVAFAIVDGVLSRFLPDVVVCYRCESRCRGLRPGGGERFGPFDLAIGERYRQERLRAEQLREAAEAATPSPSGGSSTESR